MATEPAAITEPVVEAAVEPVPIPAEDVVSGSPESSWKMLWSSPDKKAYNGIWHCTPGVFYLTHPAETICFVEGHATLTPEGGEPFEIRAGDFAFIPEGMRCRWEVHETVRKAFHSYDSGGTILAGGE